MMDTNPTMQVVYDGAGNAWLVPFNFTPLPPVSNADLESDIALYTALTQRCSSITPSWVLLLFMGDAGLGLFRRRGGTKPRWAWFWRTYLERHPAVASREAAIRAAVAELRLDKASGGRAWRPTVAELIVGRALLAALPADMRLVADAPLRVRSRQSRCDFEIRGVATDRLLLRIEVAGMVDRHGRAREKVGLNYAQHQGARMQAYLDGGLDAPVRIHADEVTDTAALATAVQGILDRLGAAGGSQHPASSPRTTRH